MAAEVRDSRAAWRSWTNLMPLAALLLLVVIWGQDASCGNLVESPKFQCSVTDQGTLRSYLAKAS